MSLKGQDLLVLLKLLVIGPGSWTYASLSHSLGMSASQVHAAVRRALEARLAVRTGARIVVNTRNLEEFLLHGLQYVFWPQLGGLTRGMPTAYAAPPLVDSFISETEPPPVWPDADGEVRGVGFSPIYKLAPVAARNDKALYQLLALVDALRGGRAREKAIAQKEIVRHLKRYEQDAKPKP